MEQIHQLERSLKYAKTDLEEAVVHSNIGVLYEKLGNLHEALDHHKKELQLSRSSDTQKMLAFRFLAECYRKLRKFGKCSQCNEKHLSLATKLGDKLETQRAYCNKGNLYLDLSEKLLERDKDEDFLHNIKMSLENFKKSLKICEILIQDIKNQNNSSARGEEKEKLILNCKRLFNEAQFNIGNCYFVWGKFEPNYFKDAIDSLGKAATYAKSLKNPILEGKAYSSMGLIRFNQKDYNQAEGYFKKDATICEANKDYQGLMLTLRNIARLYHARRQYQTSIDHFEKAKDICRRYLDSDDLEEIQQEIQEVEAEKKLKKEVEDKIKKFDQLEKKKEYSREYLLMGKEIIERLCDSLEDYEKALPITTQFIKVLRAMAPNDENLSGASLSLVTKMYSYMGIINQNLKKFDDGKRYFQEAMNIIERNDSNYERNSDYLTLLIDLGNIMDDAGDKVAAMEELYWRAFKLGEKANLANIIKASLNNLEFVYKKIKDKTSLQKIKDLKKKLSDIFEAQPVAESDNEDDDDDDFDLMEAEVYETKRSSSKKKLSATEMEIEFSSEKKREHIEILSSVDDEDTFPKENLYQMYYSKHDAGEKSVTKDTSRKETVSSKKTTPREDPSALLKKNSKKLKTLTIDDGEVVTRKKKSSFERYDQYVQKHGIPVMKNIQTQLEQRNFNIKGQLMSNWAVKSAIKSLKYSSLVEEINMKNNRAMTDCLGLLNKYLSEGGCFSKLRSLNLAYNPLVANNPASKASLILFSKLVLTKLNLDYLNLSGFKFEDDIAKKFFETLNNNTSLETLKLKNCQLQSVYLEFVKNKTLKNFVVSENSLGISSIRGLLLSEKFPSLKKLKVSFQDFYTRLKPSLSEDEVAMAAEGYALVRSANPELESLEIKGLDPAALMSISKEIRFQDTLSNLKILDLSETKDIDTLFESTAQSLMNNKFVGMHSSIRVSVFKANKVTFTYEDNIVSLFKFLSLMNFLQEFELQDVPLRQSDVDGLCEALSNFCLYISKLNLLGSLKEYSQAGLIKDRVTSLKFCFADL